jgi:hypothetical protein
LHSLGSMKVVPLIIAIALAWCLAAFAHEDTRLSLGPNGEIRQLPDQYSSARLTIEAAENPPGTLAKLIFASSGQSTSLPHCLLCLVRTTSPISPRLVGSWYHDERDLPHYVAVKFVGAPVGAADVVFFFSLRDAGLVRVWRIPEPGRIHFLTLKNGCPVSP